MKKKISSKLSLGKRSVATLSNEAMNILNGGGYTSAGGCGGAGGGRSGLFTCWATGSCGDTGGWWNDVTDATN